MAYTEEEKNIIFDLIISEIKKGRSLTSALQDESLGVKMPADNTFDKWCVEDSLKLTEYTYAREKRADKIFEEILKIADDVTDDFEDITQSDNQGSEITVGKKPNYENIQRSRLRVDARKWMLGKMQPKMYGDKVDVTSAGEKINTQSAIDLSKLSKETLESLINAEKKEN